MPSLLPFYDDQHFDMFTGVFVASNIPVSHAGDFYRDSDQEVAFREECLSACEEQYRMQEQELYQKLKCRTLDWWCSSARYGLLALHRAGIPLSTVSFTLRNLLVPFLPKEHTPGCSDLSAFPFPQSDVLVDEWRRFKADGSCGVVTCFADYYRDVDADLGRLSFASEWIDCDEDLISSPRTLTSHGGDVTSHAVEVNCVSHGADVPLEERDKRLPAGRAATDSTNRYDAQRSHRRSTWFALKRRVLLRRAGTSRVSFRPISRIISRSLA
eukprot:TRINITY_DN63854_c0_g1_i1.p1 TRINITY_DN63854_c0_g1~~TRINITY_DN63854_c0_g1_i1.p1  ORF type:complete len:270 (-),score=13.11 TRINITY_DN63854_c0_g1_i1:311-1120(-)